MQWYYPSPYKSNFDTTFTKWHFYESPTPWGPWTRFFECDCKEQSGYYNTDVISKSITYDEKTDSASMTVLTAGDWRTCDKPDTIYRMTAIPLTLNTR